MLSLYPESSLVGTNQSAVKTKMAETKWPEDSGHTILFVDIIVCQEVLGFPQKSINESLKVSMHREIFLYFSFELHGELRKLKGCVE